MYWYINLCIVNEPLIHSIVLLWCFQPYKCNHLLVIAVKPLPHLGGPTKSRCKTCSRRVTRPYRYCCLDCQVCNNPSDESDPSLGQSAAIWFRSCAMRFHFRYILGLNLLWTLYTNYRWKHCPASQVVPHQLLHFLATRLVPAWKTRRGLPNPNTHSTNERENLSELLFTEGVYLLVSEDQVRDGEAKELFWLRGS